MAVYIRSIIKDLSIAYQVLNKTAVSDGELNIGLVLIFVISALMLPSAFATHSDPYNPQNDTDRDGISDEYDQCRRQAETINRYNDEDGCPDALPLKDSDSDGISDDYDKCLTQDETVNNYQDTDGCPDIVIDSERLVIEPVTVYKYQSDDISVILFKTNQKLYVNAIRIWTEDTNVYEFFSGQNYWEGKKESNRSVIFEKNDPCCLGYSKFSIITEDPNPVIYWQVIGENKIISSGSTEHIPEITKSDPFYKDAYDMHYNTAKDDSRKKQQYKEQDLTSTKSQQYKEPTKYPANPVFGLAKGQWVKYNISTPDFKSETPFISEKISELISQTEFAYPNVEWLKMKIDNVSDSKVTMISSTSVNGKEETLVRASVELGDFAFAIPTNIKIGDTIDWMDHELVAKEYVKTTINGKQIDVLRAVYYQVVNSMPYIDVKFENLYHKDSGILLLTKYEVNVKGDGTSSNVSVGLNAIEISENLQKQTLGGGCLIATAAFGSEMAPQVQQLRELRDSSLLQTASGTAFMSSFNNFYYSFSPTIADWERENAIFKEFVRITLTPMISSLSILNYVDIDSESSVLVYGIGIILLNLGMYLVIPALVIIKTKKKLTSLHIKRI